MSAKPPIASRKFLRPLYWLIILISLSFFGGMLLNHNRLSEQSRSYSELLASLHELELELGAYLDQWFELALTEHTDPERGERLREQHQLLMQQAERCVLLSAAFRFQAPPGVNHQTIHAETPRLRQLLERLMVTLPPPSAVTALVAEQLRLRTAARKIHDRIYQEAALGIEMSVLKLQRSHFTVFIFWPFSLLGLCAIIFAFEYLERRDREAQLRIGARFQQIFENSPAGVVYFDKHGVVTECNARQVAILGGKREQHVGLNLLRIVTDPLMLEALQTCLRGGYSRYEGEYLSHIGNKRVHLKIEYGPIFDPGGAPAGGIGITEDNSEKQQALLQLQQNEWRLRESEAFLESTLNSLAFYIAILDNTSAIIFANAAWQRNDQPGQFAGAGSGVGDYYLQVCEEFRRAAADDDDEELQDKIAEMQQGVRDIISGKLTDFMLEYSCVFRRLRRWFVLRASLFERSGPLRIVITHENITAQRQAEEERRELEWHVLHTQKLESLGVLAGGIAHDFNNLLMGILGNLGLLRGKLPPHSPALHYLEQAEKASTRAAELTSQMLAYSGRGKFVVNLLDLNQLVEEMAHLLEVSISKKTRLEYEFADDLPPIEGDATQIRQVVMNLITNASEAIGENVGVITVRTGVAEFSTGVAGSEYFNFSLPPGRFVSLEVIDTGCGMDTAILNKIFDPFFTTKFTGRGLGLAGVQGIVRGHHGGIRVESRPGAGTRFQALFPAAAGRDAPEAPPAATATEWHGSGLMLVVDDEDMVREVTAEVLEELGFQVLLAADGCEAVEIFKQHQQAVSAVLLDLTMPRMNGEETARALQELRPDVPIILASGYNETDIRNRFSGQPIAGFLQKPWRTAALVDKLREIFVNPAQR